MSVGWGSLPILPLRCVLEHLSFTDALAATATCRHWRSSILVYEGRKELLKLSVKHLEKSAFVTSVFKKHVRRLHICLDDAGEDLETFMEYVLPQYFDTLHLTELVFIGPSYLQRNQYVPSVSLKRILTESLIFKHIHRLKSLVYIGCELGVAKSDNERYIHENVEHHSRSLKFNFTPSPNDTVFSRCNMRKMMFANLKYVTIDYEQIGTATLHTLNQIPLLTLLTLNVGNKRPATLSRFDWPRIAVNVRVNIIAVPQRRFQDIIANVFVEGMILTSLKVMFCKTLHIPLVTHIVRMYKATLKEFLWVDSPFESSDTCHRIVRPISEANLDMCPVNPLILLCWQCSHLKRLVIHGYWLWQYDVIGIVRLRKTLNDLDISATYDRQNRFTNDGNINNIVRVLADDIVPTPDARFVLQVNEHTEFRWAPSLLSNLHPALQGGATPEIRADYILHEATRPPVF
ncbi:uncharacterized protein LOC119836672 [Zerene cesonia]|uniref:uncharacterized protein LOC119836672 n=1 Tax=Zerene cesonia TaxID=33412 RepID=UPI0018E561F7|nr:uncharacterized protein LOC119836672 [Zerene cesonia]